MDVLYTSIKYTLAISDWRSQEGKVNILTSMAKKNVIDVLPLNLLAAILVPFTLPGLLFLPRPPTSALWIWRESNG